MPDPKDHLIKSGKEFAGFASELLDSEIQQAYQIITDVQSTYQYRMATPANLEALRDEALTRLAAIGILATVDPSPCYHGQPPVLEIIGKVDGDPIFTEGFDHGQKRHEVLLANKRGEDFYGQREEPKGKAAARARRDKDVQKLPDVKTD